MRPPPWMTGVRLWHSIYHEDLSNGPSPISTQTLTLGSIWTSRKDVGAQRAIFASRSAACVRCGYEGPQEYEIIRFEIYQAMLPGGHMQSASQ